MHHSDPVGHPDHARHDLLLIAGHAAGDLGHPDRLRAESLIATCSDCRSLHRDLIAIQAATRANPAPAARRRDYQLNEDQAARLRRGSWLRGILRPFGSARSSTRPLAAAFTSVGVAGLLVAALVPGLLGSPAAAPTQGESAFTSGAGAAGGERDLAAGASAAPAGIPDQNEPAPQPSVVAPAIEVESFGPEDPDKLTGVPFAPNPTDTIAVAAGNPELQKTAETDVAAGQPTTTRRLREAQPSTNLLLIGSMAFLGVGLALFGLRFAARRVR